MKSLIAVITCVVIIVFLGLNTFFKFEQFSDCYTHDINIIKNHIKDDEWLIADYKLNKYSNNFNNEKLHWYKLLNHSGFENISASINILKSNIYCKNKVTCFEQIEQIKSYLFNIWEDEKIDLNHIF